MIIPFFFSITHHRHLIKPNASNLSAELLSSYCNGKRALDACLHNRFVWQKPFTNHAGSLVSFNFTKCLLPLLCSYGLHNHTHSSFLVTDLYLDF